MMSFGSLHETTLTVKDILIDSDLPEAYNEKG